MAPRLPVVLLVAIVAFVGRFLYDRLNTLGAFRSNLQPYLDRARATPSNSDIKYIPDTINAEDLHYDPKSGLIFAAAQDQDGSRAGWFPPLTRFSDPSVLSTANGGLRVIDPKTFTTKRLRLEGFSGPFSTHGIDIIRDEIQDAVFIHAVNHLPNPSYAKTLDQSIPDKGNSVIEIFHHEIGTDIARHVRTVSHPLIETPNDIFATGPLSFYVTNDHHYRDGHWRLVEDLGSKATAGWANTIYVEAQAGKGTNGKDTWAGVFAKVAHQGLHNNNGLGHTPTDGELMICDAAGGITYIATRRDDKTLTIVDEVKFETSIDNPFWFQDPYPTVEYDASGIVNSGLSQALKLADAIGGDEPIAPAIWLASGKTGEKWNTTLLFADDGTNLRSASASVLIAIDPEENGGKKQAWLFSSGFASKSAIATKVDL